MKSRVNAANPGLTGQEERVLENGPGSPSSGDESKLAGEPSPKKSRRDVQKRVVSVPIGDVEGYKSKGETYPPSDSWAWRKYGQKPIKGSPYPRGYYRCSSSKGCPARKQVERSRVDPTTLVITYSCDHNHPVPTTKSHHSTSSAPAPAPSPAPSPAPAPAPAAATSSSGDSATSPSTSAAVALSFAVPSAFELGEDSMLANNSGIFGWIDDVAHDSVLESPIFDGNGGSDVAMVLSMREEDESLFADLEELPECSLVFRGRLVEQDETNRRCDCSFGPVTCCAGTG